MQNNQEKNILPSLKKFFIEIKLPLFDQNGAKTPLLGAFGPQKWEHPTQPREKKFGRRHRKIAENRVFTVLVITVKH